MKISPEKKKLIIYLFLIVTTFAVFWQVNQYDFINFDDNVYVKENSNIQSGITVDGIRWAFSTKHFGLWNPLVWLSLMLDYQLFGLKAGGYHLTNLIFHILSTVLLFWLFNRMTGGIWKSAFVAGLFALHPLHVESVAWIAERKDVLSAFFWMMTLCFYVYYTEKPVIRRYLLVLFAFILALMSKPMVVTLPVIMILLDYWPLKRFESKKGSLILWQIKEKAPFFILSTFIVILTIYTPQNTFIRTIYSPYEISSGGFFLLSRIFNAPVTFVTYLGKTFWPHSLAIFYPFTSDTTVFQITGASLIITLISVIIIVMRRRLPYLFTGWLWYAITVAPVTGIMQIGAHSMADRYTYIPLIGIFLMLGWGIPAFIQSEKIRKDVLFPVGIFFIAIMAFLAWQQCGYWKNSVTLFSHALQATEGDHLIHTNLAMALSEEGRIDEAIYHYHQAIKIAPDGIPYNNLGNIYADLGQNQKAMDYYNKAIHLRPDYANAYNNRAVIYFNQGNYKAGCMDVQKACDLGICSKLESAKVEGLCR